MKILTAVTYYSPYVSGLTIYAQRIAQAWADEGHEVTVLTSQHSPDLPLEETKNGVHIVRAPILFRISKGVIMPAFWGKAIRLVKDSDIISLHLPQFDAAWLAFLAKIHHKPSVITYHCDLLMPSGFINQLSNKIMLFQNNVAGNFSTSVVAYTEDYAAYSFFLPHYKDKTKIIQPPVILPEITEEEENAFRQKTNANSYKPIIGMACRFAADKGVQILLKALPKIIEKFPNVCVFFAGPYKDVLGERAYYEKLKPELDQFIATGHWKFLGSLSPKEMAEFYQTIDVLAMPSLNRTDSFGLVQIESMMSGKPVVAANLPGIRVPVQRHHMGMIIPIGDSNKLAEDLITVIEQGKDYSFQKEDIKKFYNPDTVASLYTNLFNELLSKEENNVKPI